jgi:predicted secreted protein
MAKASTLPFSQFLIKLGDGNVPETFRAPCGLNSRGFSRTAATNDTNVPDCDDPDAPSWLDRDVVSLSGSLSGSGVLADEDYDVWEAWLVSGTSKNVQIILGTRTWLGAAILTKLDITGSRGQRVQLSVTIDTDGPMVLQ